MKVIRDEWKDAASSLAAANTPSANVVAMGKHLMFWERHTDFNAVLDRFLDRLEQDTAPLVTRLEAVDIIPCPRQRIVSGLRANRWLSGLLNLQSG